MSDLTDAGIPDTTKQTLREGLKGVGSVLNPVQLQGACKRIGDAERAVLELAATLLPQGDVLIKTDLDQIRESLAGLQKLTEEADISPTLKKSILELIRLTNDAIARFRIHGASGFKKRFKQMIGEAALLSQEIDKETVEGKSVIERVQKHLLTIDGVLARITKYKPMFDYLVPLMLGK